MKKKEIMLFAGKWMELEIMSKSDSVRQTMHVFSYMQNLDLKKKTRTWT
jgi:hypothetical protein